MQYDVWLNQVELNELESNSVMKQNLEGDS